MILVKIDSIPGDFDTKELKKHIACTSCSWDIEREPKEAGKAGTTDINLGIAELPPLEFSKLMDKASVFLMQNAIAGHSLGTVEVKFLTTAGTKSEAKVYLEYKLDTAVVSSWSMSGTEDDRPEETFKLWYKKVWMQYWTTEDGKTYTKAGSKGWDRTKQVEWSI